MTSSTDPLATRVPALRADTAGTASVAHLNNAGSALPPRVVTDTMVAFLRREEEIGGYEAHAEAADRVDLVRSSVERLIGGEAGSVALVESATVGWDRALQALVHSGALAEGDEVLVASSEYASNVLPLLQLVRSHGIDLQFVPDGADGSLDIDALDAMITPRTALVALTHAPSQNGVLNDVTAAGSVIAASGSPAWYLVDACQSAGQLPLDVSRIGCDFLSATGRKFLRGPRGTGFLYASPRALRELEPFPLDVHSGAWSRTGDDGEDYRLVPGAQRFETWEKSYAAVLGLGAAVDYALDLGVDAIAARIGTVAAALRQRLAGIPGVVVRDRGEMRSGIVTFTQEGVDPADLVTRLRTAGVNVSRSGSDYALRDFANHGLASQVRVSPHVFTDEDDIGRLIEVVGA